MPTAPVGPIPCFADATKPLVATAVWRQLEKYSWTVYETTEPPPPPTTYGSCTVDRNAIRDARGLVAELGCGMRIVRRGIVDELGLEIGARGQAVLDRKPRPVQPLTCLANGPDQVRCHFDREPEADSDATWYVVGGTLADGRPLTGTAATTFFAARELLEIHVSIWCH